MTLIKRTYPEFPQISNWLEDIFAKDFDFVSKMKGTIPLVNIRETNDNYVIELAAPGLQKDSFDLDLDNNVLTISSKTEQNEVSKEVNYTKKEFNYCSFKRAFTLPETADVDNISAKYEAGILEITIAKKDEAKVQPKRKIDIG